MKAKQQEKEVKLPFEMNLQLFGNEPTNVQPSQADLTAQAMQILQGGNQQPSGQAPTMEQPMMQGEGNPQNSPQPIENGGQHQVEGQGQPTNQPTGMEQPGQQAPTNELIAGKFKSPDEVLNAYLNLESMNTKTRQESAAKDQQMQAMQQAMEQMKQQIASVVNPQQQAQPTPEEQNEQFMNSFYENPTGSLQQMVQQMIEKAVMPQIAPMQQQYKAQQQQQMWNQARNEMSSQIPDFQQMQPAIEQIIANNPELQGHPGGPQAALNIAYQMARGQQYQDPNSLLQNKDFVNQNILNNDDIKNQIIQQYLQSMKQGNQAPTVISGQANGSIPVMPANKPQNMQEAREAAMKLIQG